METFEKANLGKMGATIVRSIEQLSEICYDLAHENGWHEIERSGGEVIALMHSELSEALEAMRESTGTPSMSTKIPEFTGVEEELADTIIRIMDYGWQEGLKIGEALVAKLEYNKSRGYRHGGKKF